ncbi:MAG TPA: YicC/YloC family endoribonuclease, partial [Kofleriaceae bacterium]|nr:YicC/YloC family endoribonuclease [Kofleriaceae bacterium]
MTGYGRGVVEHGDVRATVDLRAVNHRFLDLKLRGASVPAAIEDAIAGRVRGAIERGAVTVSVHLARGGAPSGMRIDADAAERVHRALAAVAARLSLPGPDLALVLGQPGVITADDRLDDGAAGDTAGDAILRALDAALVQLGDMRKAEGAALAAELHARLGEIAAARTHIATLAGAVPHVLARRMLDRVQRLVDEVGLDGAI